MIKETLNLTATFTAFRLFAQPSLILPSTMVKTFNDIPIPLPQHIKAIVLDKDNCFAKAYDDKVWPEYTEKWNEMIKAYPNKVLIVSNSAGTLDDINYGQAQTIEATTGVPVLRHDTKKPGCSEEIMKYFAEKGITNNPAEVAVVGDRLMTDVMMGNLMGAYSVWVKDGVKIGTSPIIKLEKALYSILSK